MKRSSIKFTLVEIVLVIAIILVLMGLVLPLLHKAKFKAKSVRWFAYNSGLNRDPELVLNYNFQNPDTRMGTSSSGVCDVVLNGAVGCGFDGFKPIDYNAVMKNSPEWRNSGRWQKYDRSMIFDGFTDYLEVPGSEVLKLSPGNADFTIAGSVKFDTLGGIQTVVSKSLWPNYAVFTVYSQGTSLKAEVGSLTLSSNGNSLVPGKWTQFALVADGGSISFHVGGKLADSSAFGTGGKIVIAHDPGDGSSPVIIVVSANGWNGHDSHPNDYIVSADPNLYMHKNKLTNIMETKVLIGAAGMQDGPPSFFLKGAVDEIILSRRAWNAEAVRGYFDMGNPY